MLYKNWCHSIDYNEVNKISGYILATKTLRTKRIVRMINHKTHIKRIDNTLYKRSYECKRRVSIVAVSIAAFLTTINQISIIITAKQLWMQQQQLQQQLERLQKERSEL